MVEICGVCLNVTVQLNADGVQYRGTNILQDILCPNGRKDKKQSKKDFAFDFTSNLEKVLL